MFPLSSAKRIAELPEAGSFPEEGSTECLRRVPQETRGSWKRFKRFFLGLFVCNRFFRHIARTTSRGKKARVNAASATGWRGRRKGEREREKERVEGEKERDRRVTTPKQTFVLPCPPVATPVQYLRARKPPSDFHLSRFASLAIQDISARARCFALESERRTDRRATSKKLSLFLVCAPCSFAATSPIRSFLFWY